MAGAGIAPHSPLCHQGLGEEPSLHCHPGASALASPPSNRRGDAMWPQPMPAVPAHSGKAASAVAPVSCYSCSVAVRGHGQWRC